MTEVSKTPQFVGSADATREAGNPAEFTLSPEQQAIADVLKQQGEMLEKTIVDARQKAGEKLKELKGKELVKAGLKQMGIGVLETMKAQIKWGFAGGMLGSVLGGHLGILSGWIVGNIPHGDIQGTLGVLREKFNNSLWLPEDNQTFGALLGGAGGGALGALIGLGSGIQIGYETSGVAYNKLAEVKGMPPAKWYDWALSHGVLSLLALPIIQSASTLSVDNKTMMHVMSSMPNATDQAKDRYVGQKLMIFNIGQTVFNPATMGGLRNVLTGLWHMRKERQHA